MADQTPPTDPLGDRLRATFTAERDDLERRHLAGGAAPARSRSLKWIPFAVAAAVIAIAGFAFVANRSDDQAVELDVAAQTPDGQTPDAQTPDEESASDDLTTPTSDASPSVDASAQPVPAETPGVTVETPVAPVATDCSLSSISPTPHLVWDVAIDDPDGGLIAHSGPGVDAPVTRVLDHNAMVVPAGGCFTTENGSEWYEIEIPGVGNNWVNARFLKRAAPFCLQGESFGVADQTVVRDPDIVHTVAPGETIDDIAATYDVTVYSVLEANPALNPASLGAGSVLRISAGTAVGTLVQGPISGWGISDGDTVAFRAQESPYGLTYLWHPADRFSDGVSCSDGASEGFRLCLTGDISLLSSPGEAPTWTGTGPIVAWHTGTRSGAFLEVDLIDPVGQLVTGFVIPNTTGRCLPSGGDSLLEQPCTRLPQQASVRSSLFAGQRDPSADHVHDVRAESNDECTRLVVEFGVDANEESDAAANVMPVIQVDFDNEWVKITPTSALWEGAFGDPDRVDYPDGVGLLVVSAGFEFSVQFRHQAMEPHVRFMSDPARVVIDLFPIDGAPTDAIPGQPFGDNFVLRGPIQKNPTGPGIEVDNDIVVAGYGRPFEASGLYRIWSVAADTDPVVFLVDPPAPLIEDFFPTSSWADGWGEFFVPLPDLEPGSYIAVFGELPPTDEIGFYGTGQLFRVAAPDDPADASYPPAVLLPDVQLAPELPDS